jgi:hypothetical protein
MGLIKKSPENSELLCAQDWIRTSTPLPAPPPQSGLSTNFNTWATLERSAYATTNLPEWDAKIGDFNC